MGSTNLDLRPQFGVKSKIFRNYKIYPDKFVIVSVPIFGVKPKIMLSKSTITNWLFKFPSPSLGLILKYMDELDEFF